MTIPMVSAPAVDPKPGKCGVCGHEVDRRFPELMMGPNGFRVYDACRKCLAEWNAKKAGGSKPIFATRKDIN